MEEKREVRTFEVDFKCPKCNIGYLRPTGIAVGSTPMQYPHKCSNCDYHKIIKDRQYPYLVYEPLNDGSITIVMNDTVEHIHGKDYKEKDKQTMIGSEGEMHEELPKEINNYVPKKSGK